jgi:hypothetical protein
VDLVIDVGAAAATVFPFLTAAIGAYGGQVVSKAMDQAVDHGVGAAADATVGIGRRMLGRLLRSSRSEEIAAAVDHAAKQPDEASAAALLAQLRQALSDDAELAADLVSLLPAAPAKYQVTVTDSTGVQTGDGNTLTIHVQR